MPQYYVNDNAQPTGEHEVHKAGCSWLALARSTTALGVFSDCRGAVTKAREHYANADGCKHCCPACHTR